MKYHLKRYGLITVSLAALFASGLAAGYRLGLNSGTAKAPVAVKQAAESTPDQWIENTALALQKDLGLDESQVLKVRNAVTGPAMGIYSDKRQANFKIHLRLLEVHDTLARETGLTGKQQALLKVRREQLRRHILEKFKDIIGEKPDPLLSSNL